MATNQTIDGVPRDDLELVLLHGHSTHESDQAWDRLRALLDAKPQSVSGHHPACRAVDDYKPGECSHSCKSAAQRKIDPVVSGWQLDSFDEKLEGLDPTATCTLSNHDVAQLVSAVRTLQVRQLTAPAAQPPGEPFAWYTEDYLTDKSATTYDLATMERWKAKGWPVKPLYIEQPAPVAVAICKHFGWTHINKAESCDDATQRERGKP